MPKSNIVFRESLEDEESDDEIVIIPYTKPTPVIIDLLDSGSDNDNGASKKSPKKKAKKKKRKKDKERGQGGSTNVASLDDLSQVSSVVSSLNASASVPDNSNECDEEINSGQAVEPATSTEVDCGSENVAAGSNLSSTGSSSDTQLPLNPLHTEAVGERESGSSSRFEKCLDAQSSHSEVTNGKRTESGMMMDVTPLAQNNDRPKRVRSSEKKSNKGAGKSPRVRTTSASSATQRTNEEIVNFLTTLGIQMEPNAFETPVTRKKQPRKRPSQVPTAVAESEGNSLDSSATNSNDGLNFPAPIKEATAPATSSTAFVSVTQDISSASKRDLGTPKGRRLRKAINGDLSDYTVSFTNKELNAINTNFQSNVRIGETENRLENTRDGFISVLSSDTSKPKQKSSSHTMKPNYYSEVIDAVARGLHPSMLFSPNLESNDKLSKNDNNQHLSAQQTTTINETNSEEIIESLNSHNNENGSHVQTIVNCDQEATTEDQIANNHVEQTNVAAIASNNSDTGMDHDQLNKSSPRTTSTPITVAKEVVESEVVGGANSNVVEVNKSASFADKSPPPVVTGVEKLPQTPKEGDKSNENFTRDVQCKRKFSDDDDNEPSAASASLRTNKNSGEAGIIKVIGNKEISDSDRVSPERKRRKINNNIIPAPSKTRNDNDDIRERTSEKEGRRVQEVIRGSGGGSVLSPVQQMVPRSNTVAAGVPQESYYPSTWSDHMRDFYGSIRDNDFELNKVFQSLPNSENLWRAYKDMMPPPRNKRRHVRCDRCKQWGHLIKECTEKWKQPTCHYCGEGGHTSDNHSRHNRTCPSALCLNCGRQLERYAQKCERCLLQRRPHRCEICNVSGHNKSICPDNWRRYHAVTSSDEYEKTKDIVKLWSDESHRKNLLKDPKLYKRPSTMYCANCGRRGHYYYDCGGSKFHPYPRHKPFVVCVAQTSEVEGTIGTTYQCSGPSSTASTPISPIPISYDSRTGRTVVMNAETKDQPELEVEIIQVKITNELALKSDESQASNVLPIKEVATLKTLFTDSDKESTVLESKNTSIGQGTKTVSENEKKALYKYTCENRKCTNKLRRDEKCYQALMESQAHLKLLRAQHKGVLKQLEERNQVQISVIHDGCKIHIAGSDVLGADKDLHKLLLNVRTQVPGSSDELPIIVGESDNNPKIISRDTLVVAGTSRRVITIDEEDECVIVEITNSAESSVSITKKPEKAIRVGDDIQGNNRCDKESFFMDKSASVDTEGICKEPSAENVPKSSAAGGKNETAKEQIPSSSSTVKTSWSEYVSPLTGLSLSSNSKDSMSSKNEDDMDVTVNDSPSSPDMFDDVEEMDYSTMEIQDTSVQQLSKITNEDQRSSDSDLMVLPPPPSVEPNVEIITIDDDDDDDDDEEEPEPPKQISARKEESVTLLQSEWQLAMTELAKKDNIISQIADEFNVNIMVSKEISSVLVKNGTEQARKLAKDEIVYWLESKCLNTDYHLVRRKVEKKKQQTPNSPKPKKKSQPKQRVLRLHDVQQNNLLSQQKSKKKRKGKPKRKVSYNNSTSSASRTSSGSPTTSRPPTNNQSSLNKWNLKKSSPSSSFHLRGLVHSPTPKKMQQQNSSNKNNSNASFSIVRGGAASIGRKARYFDN